MVYCCYTHITQEHEAYEAFNPAPTSPRLAALVAGDFAHFCKRVTDSCDLPKRRFFAADSVLKSPQLTDPVGFCFPLFCSIPEDTIQP